MTGGHFDGRVAVVTGASRGLGAAYARLLAAEGARVVANGRPPQLSPAPASEVVAAIKAAGGEAVADYHDVTASSCPAMPWPRSPTGFASWAPTFPARRLAYRDSYAEPAVACPGYREGRNIHDPVCGPR